MSVRLVSISLAAALGAACTPPTTPATQPASAISAPAVTPAPVASASPSPACVAAEFRQFDFWIGTWDLVVKTRNDPQSPWVEAPGVQRIEPILGGCAIAEHFTAEGPGVPWAGNSYSVWQPALGKWRQTWVDDQGGYLAFVGAVEDGAMTLYGEPVTRNGGVVEMRMTFLDVTADALRWEWQRKAADGTWAPQMIIEYRRAAP